MAKQLPLEAKAPVTLRTLEGPLSTVDTKVLRELRLSRKTLATLPAREWPLFAVGALVGLQDALQAEALVAIGALKRPLSAVHSQMLTELALVGEASATLAAGERPCSATSQLVGSQPALRMEAQLTYYALKGLFLGMKPLLVPQQLSLLTEVPSILRTPECFLPAEGLGMFYKFALFGEALSTLSTGEQSFPTLRTLVDTPQASQAEVLATFCTLKGFFSCACLTEAGLLRL